MATNLHVVGSVTIQTKTEGAPEAAAGLKSVDNALQAVAKSGAATATVTETVSKSQLSMADAFARNERRLVAGVRQQQEYEKVVRETNAAIAQNPGLQERGNAVIAAAAVKYGQASAAAQIFSDVTKGVSGQLIALSAGFGPVGVALSAIPGWGLAAAAGLGVLTAGFNAVDGAANKLAEKATAIHTFSVSTGFSTAEVQALRIEAGKFGNSSEEIETALRRFAGSFEEIRTHSGGAFEALQKYVPLYAKEISQAESYGEALTLVAKAQSQIPQGQRLLLDAALFGKGGRGMTEFISSLDVGEITNKLSAAGRVLDTEFIKKMRQVSIDIAETEKQISENIGKIFALPYLEQRLAAIREFRDLLVGIKGLASDVGSVTSHFTPGVGTTTQLPLNVGANRNISDRDMANQEGPTPSSAITKGAPAIDKLPAPDMTATINDMKAVISILGDAATATDHYNLRILELNKALADGKISTDIYNRAIESAGSALTQTDIAFQNSIQSIKARTAAEREAAAASAASASTPGGAAEQQLAASRATTLEIEKQAAAHRDAMVGMQGQLGVAQAVGGAEKMAAQEVVTFNQLVHEGRTEEQALAEAAMQRKVAQAQINLRAGEMLQSLQDQHAVSSARTTDERIHAEALATANRLMSQGVDKRDAMKVAAQQEENALAAVNAQFVNQLAMAEAVTGAQKIAAMDWREAAVATAQVNSQAREQLNVLRDQAAGAAAVTGEQQIQAAAVATVNQLLRQGVDIQLAMSIAAQQTANAQAKANAAVDNQIHSLEQETELIYAKLNGEEASVKAAQAYANAMRDGADAAHAAAIETAVLANEAAKAEAAAAQAAESRNKNRRGALMTAEGANAVVRQYEYEQGQQAAWKDLQEQFGISESDYNKYKKGGTTGDRAMDRVISGLKPGYYGPLNPGGISVQQVQKQISGEDQLASLKDAFDLIGKTGEEKAKIESQQTYKNLIRDGTDAALAQAIANQQLQNAMAELKTSVDANTESQLDAIYTQGHSALKIGYYGEGSSGGTINATDWGTSPSNPAAGPVTTGPNAPNVSTPWPNVGGAGPSGAGSGTPHVGDTLPDSPTSPGPGWYHHGGGITGQGPWVYGIPSSPWLADGGVIPPYGLAYVGEHGPNPKLMRAGSEAITVTPHDLTGTAYLPGDSHTWYGPGGARWDDRSGSVAPPWYPSTPEARGWSHESDSSPSNVIPFPGIGAGLAGGSWVDANSPYAHAHFMAAGGTIPPYGMAYVGEHGPNPRLLQAGGSPITVTPGNADSASRAPNVVNNNITNITFNVPQKSNLSDRGTRRQLLEGFGRATAA